MNAEKNVARTLTELDHARLERLLRQIDPASANAAALVRVLDEADLVPSGEIPPDVVTMNSRFRMQADGAEAPQPFTLAYPSEADPASRALSVLSPAGIGVLGSRVGAEVVWQGPDGRSQRYRVTAIDYQPEDRGDLLR